MEEKIEKVVVNEDPIEQVEPTTIQKVVAKKKSIGVGFLLTIGWGMAIVTGVYLYNYIHAPVWTKAMRVFGF